MYCKILSAAPEGVEAYLVEVEVDLAAGLPMFQMVGSIGTEVRESRERVSVALKNSGIRMPVSRITVNLSPADVRKEGTGFDLAIAVGILENMKYFKPENAEGILFLGELGLDGELRSVRGVLPMVRMAASLGIQTCIVPKANLMEGSVVPKIRVLGAGSMREVLDYLISPKENPLEEAVFDPEGLFRQNAYPEETSFSVIAGQENAKRAAKIAAGGFHNLLFVGPPGAGKSMIAKCIPDILPPLTLEESLEITTVRSVAGLMGEGETLVTKRPFLNPHHTVTLPAFAGGGTVPRPGVMSLAHRGVLFMDELPEFGRGLIDVMRQPLEERVIHLSRMQGSIRYPANFLLVCAMNPCPCGYYPDRNRCQCTESSIRRYMGRVSGPILDRIDLCVEMQAVGIENLKDKKISESAEEIRMQVGRARERQRSRFEGTKYHFNSEINAGDIEKFCALGAKEEKCMEQIYQHFSLSVRSYHRILKCARTIADLAGEDTIREEHLLEAASFRPSQDYWMQRVIREVGRDQ